MQSDPEAAERAAEARRRFLAECGRFAVATPPAITLILAEAGRNYTFAQSGGSGYRQGNNGLGNGGWDGVPGNSGNNPSPNADEKNRDEIR